MSAPERESYGSSLKTFSIRLWNRFWRRADRDRDAGYIKAAIADAQRRHMPVAHLQKALGDLREAQLRAAVSSIGVGR